MSYDPDLSFDFHGRIVPGESPRHSFGVRVVSNEEVVVWILSASEEVQTEIREPLETLLLTERSPGAIIHRLNQLLYSPVTTNRFAEVCVAFLNRETQTMRVSAAIDFRPYVCRKGQWLRMTGVEAPGLPVGVLPDIEDKTQEIGFPRGASLLWISPYTMQIRGADQWLYGLSRFPRTIDGLPHSPLAAVESVALDVLDYRGSGRQFDDICVLGFRWKE